MKPIIVDMKDMSDSTEVYESRPNRFLVYTIYVIFALLITAFVWMSVAKMDVVVKSNGMFRGDENVCEIGSGVTGYIEECFVENGQSVKEGDVLFSIKNESLNESIKMYEQKKEEVQKRIEILEAYQKSLDGDSSMLDGMTENPYYHEILNRKTLLQENQKAGSEDIQGQIQTYQKSIDGMNDSIRQSKTKIRKLQQVKDNVFSRVNEFGSADSYFSSIVNSYISNYNLTAGQYDAQITEFQEQMEKSETEEEKNLLQGKIETLTSEKSEALSNLEYQQISGVEQLIETENGILHSLQSNLTTAQLQMESVKNSQTSNSDVIQKLTEKEQVTSEIRACQKEALECESYLKNYHIQGDNCNVLAAADGYFYFGQELSVGAYIQEGTSIGKIYPNETNSYYAELYVDNADIGKLRKGQNVKFEIAAYPSSEYGYFTGTIVDIPKDIFVNQNDGSAHYMVKADCDSEKIQNKAGKTASIMNGMACQAKVVVEEKSVMKYVLEKIDLLD